MHSLSVRKRAGITVKLKVRTGLRGGGVDINGQHNRRVMVAK